MSKYDSSYLSDLRFLYLIVFILLILSLISRILLSIINHKIIEEKCFNYQDFGYETKIYASYSEALFLGKPVCLIVMEDGTKLPIEDFKTYQVKNAKRRN